MLRGCSFVRAPGKDEPGGQWSFFFRPQRKSAGREIGRLAQICPTPEETSFKEVVRPLLEEHCLRCHNAARMEAGKRLDQLDGALEDRHLFLWQHVLHQLLERAMPPEDEPQLSEPQRQSLVEWVVRGADAADEHAPSLAAAFA